MPGEKQAEKPTTQERLKQITDKIEAGIRDLFASDQYRAYLSTMSRFHQYSFNNSVLIYLQNPKATRVASYTKWKDSFGRQVKRGEHGITIIAPTPYKKKVEEVKTDPDTKLPLLDKDGREITEERIITIPYFKPVFVFDVSQTEGRPLPQIVHDLTGNVEHYEAFLEAMKRSSPVPVLFDPDVREDGFYNTVDREIHTGSHLAVSAISSLYMASSSSLMRRRQATGSSCSERSRIPVSSPTPDAPASISE